MTDVNLKTPKELLPDFIYFLKFQQPTELEEISIRKLQKCNPKARLFGTAIRRFQLLQTKSLLEEYKVLFTPKAAETAYLVKARMEKRIKRMIQRMFSTQNVFISSINSQLAAFNNEPKEVMIEVITKDTEEVPKALTNDESKEKTNDFFEKSDNLIDSSTVSVTNVNIYSEDDVAPETTAASANTTMEVDSNVAGPSVEQVIITFLS